MDIKVFALNDYEWWAAKTPEEARSGYLENQDMDHDEEPIDCPRELTAAQMQSIRYRDDGGTSITFREQLANMVAGGQQVPCFFASRE